MEETLIHLTRRNNKNSFLGYVCIYYINDFIPKLLFKKRKTSFWESKIFKLKPWTVDEIELKKFAYQSKEGAVARQEVVEISEII